MFDCANLIHPFQNDPGVSQRQRIIDDLLAGSAKIDGRSMADLLDYFVQLSRHVNYYDTDLSVSDWQPFFRKSIPFSLATIIKYNRNTVTEKMDYYTKIFDKRPSKTGLQLLFHYFFYQVVSQINNWNVQLKSSGLPAELIIEKLIKDKLRDPLKKLVCLHQAAVKWYCVKPISLQSIFENEIWDLDSINASDDSDSCKPVGSTRRQKLIKLGKQVKVLLPSFLDAIRIISDTAEQSLEQSFFPLKEELQKQHTPHLALLFSFLKLFQQLQSDLNTYTKKHLDFFYKQVLQLKAKDAIADRAHIVFEIQKQLNKYVLKNGLLVKDGKDNNKAEILFALEDELVVNKAQVAEKRTLFLNNQNVFAHTYVEGVYMAPNADKADGLAKDFKDTDPKSFPTLGAKLSKYIAPEKTFAQPYPNARIGFILASPVMLLNEGTRNITISLSCQLTPGCQDADYPEFFSSEILYSKIRQLAAKGFYYINQDLISEGAKRGVSEPTIDKLKEFLFVKSEEGCCDDEAIYNSEAVITARNWRLNFYNGLAKSEKDILSEIFIERRIFKIWFSGKEEWIKPSNVRRIRFSQFDAASKQFTITIKTRLKPDKPEVTFYDKEKLKEDFDTTLPLVKVELDDVIKIYRGFEVPKAPCCLQIKPDNSKRYVSFYHFFRDVKIIDKIGSRETKIDVRVCGVKNFIVQNDESVQDVNGSIFPFGARPDIIDFDVNHNVSNIESIPGYPTPIPVPIPNLIGPNFYIGSKEIFLKKWNTLCVNLNWKDKPVDFNDFYTAYIKREIPDPNNPGNIITILGLNEADFQISLALLDNSKWQEEKNTSGKGFTNTITGNYNRKLFVKELCAAGCIQLNKYDYSYLIERTDFPGESKFLDSNVDLNKYEADTQNGFVRFNLQNQDFLHKDYAYVLARQMMAIGKFPDKGVEGAIYLGTGNAVIVFKDTGSIILAIKQEIEDAVIKSGQTKAAADLIISRLGIVRDPSSPGGVTITNAEFLSQLNLPISNTSTRAGETKDIVDSIILKVNLLQTLLSIFKPSGELKDDLSVPIPNEPWTPIIKNISLDYTATALSTDIDLIHLYPYDGTYKKEEITLHPTLFPTFCDEGTLFIGLKDLEPGSNVNMLFQLAEATADSESDREEVEWYYLDNNQWKSLRKGFEILDDATDGLTTSGIVKFSLPENMTMDNTVLPKGVHWIKVSIPKNSRTVSETMAIYTQAILTVFTNDAANDKLRLDRPLATGAITKLNEPDANVKKLTQPFDSFGGRVPEEEGHFYVRVSELLRHKGRAIQKFDYERIALEAFPQLFKVKCINHSFALNAHQYKNDFPIAPGYVLLAVIPDLNQLKAAQSFEPRVPVSMLDNIQKYLKKITSPFVRFRAMNPRYERIHFCLKVKLVLGKDENYYKEKMKQDLREFLAPWSVGQYDKLSFGQCVGRSEVIQFLETRDYIDYITDLLMRHDEDNWPDKSKEEELVKPICPKTPRSILIAGDIDVCILDKDCAAWDKCFDAQGQEVICCENKKIPIAEYCQRNIPG